MLAASLPLLPPPASGPIDPEQNVVRLQRRGLPLPTRDEAESAGDPKGRQLRDRDRPDPGPNRSRALPLAMGNVGFLAQRIAQEDLGSGLYWEPWAATSRAYRMRGAEPYLAAGFNGSASLSLSA